MLINVNVKLDKKQHIRDLQHTYIHFSLVNIYKD